MRKGHDSPARRVGEPVQVYLQPSDRKRLDRLVEELETSKSDVLRRALEALEYQLSDPEEHPVLRIVGVAGSKVGGAAAASVAGAHDKALAEDEINSWSPRRKRAR